MTYATNNSIDGMKIVGTSRDARTRVTNTMRTEFASFVRLETVIFGLTLESVLHIQYELKKKNNDDDHVHNTCCAVGVSWCLKRDGWFTKSSSNATIVSSTRIYYLNLFVGLILIHCSGKTKIVSSSGYVSARDFVRTTITLWICNRLKISLLRKNKIIIIIFQYKHTRGNSLTRDTF